MIKRLLAACVLLLLWPASPIAEISTDLAYCSGCGCRGGPGWRIHKTGKCASYKNIAKQCGNPPNPNRCTNELGAARNSRAAPAQQFVPNPPRAKKKKNRQIQGRATVIDADTIEIQGERVRIWGIDAPEGKQTCLDAAGAEYRCGQIGSMALADFIDQSQPVRCEHKDTDRYGRFVGQCFIASGHDIAGWLARQGHALDYRQYSKGAYASAEARAKANKAGIWQGSFIEPWVWRNGGR